MRTSDSALTLGNRQLPPIFSSLNQTRTTMRVETPALLFCMNGEIASKEHFAIPDTAADRFDNTLLSDAERVQTGRTNAIRLFNLDLEQAEVLSW